MNAVVSFASVERCVLVENAVSVGAQCTQWNNKLTENGLHSARSWWG